jgi:hypothetical protein
MNVNPAPSKYATRFSDEAAGSAVSDAEGTENLGAFGCLRGSRDRSEMLELRKKTGNIRAIGYGWIEKVDYDPSTGITLFVSGGTIRIQGRNLNAIVSQQISLLGGILRHRVPWIGEADQSIALQSDKSAVIVEKIDW